MIRKGLLALWTASLVIAAQAHVPPVPGHFRMASEIEQKDLMFPNPNDPSCIRVDWDKIAETDQQYLAEGFVFLGFTDFEVATLSGEEYPAQKEAIEFGKKIGAEVILIASHTTGINEDSKTPWIGYSI